MSDIDMKRAGGIARNIVKLLTSDDCVLSPEGERQWVLAKAFLAAMPVVTAANELHSFLRKTVGHGDDALVQIKGDDLLATAVRDRLQSLNDALKTCRLEAPNV